MYVDLCCFTSMFLVYTCVYLLVGLFYAIMSSLFASYAYARFPIP